MAFVAKRGVNLQKRFLGYTRKEIKNLGDFIQTLQVNIYYIIIWKKNNVVASCNCS
jgi:hypothetical protein